jgi:hypothetical protein
MSDLIRINDTFHSWESVSLEIDGDPWNGFTGIDWEQARTRTLVYGARKDGKPLGRTSGKYEPKPISMTWLRSSWNLLCEYLSIEGLGSYGDAEFDITLQYEEEGDIQTIAFLKCTIDNEKDGNQEGTDALTTDATIGTLDITRNGLSLYSLIRNIL